VTRDDFDSGDLLRAIAMKPLGTRPRERVEIYANAWRLRLEESLRDDYPSLSERMGTELWETLIVDYIRSCPSNSYTIARAGDQLPSFLAECGDDRVSSVDVELALLERAIYRARYAADSADWDPGKLLERAAEDAGQVRLELQPSVQMFKFDHPVHLLLKETSQTSVESPCVVIVYRKEDFNVEVEVVEPSRTLFLSMVQEKRSFAEIFDAVDSPDWVEWMSEYALKGVLKPVA
jgi:hypothetical protein